MLMAHQNDTLQFHDHLLFYARSDAYLWTDLKIPHDPAYIEEHFDYEDENGRLFQPITLTGSGVRHGASGHPWKEINPTTVGRHWAIPGEILEKLGLQGDTVQDKLDALDSAGMIYWPKKKGGTPRLKWYADQLEGVAMPDIWTDISPISARAAERLGYPTQKPEALLERIIRASSNEGDVVLDPFCGCGTAVAVAQRLNRQWIGIDITYLAITLMKHRLHTAYGEEVKEKYQVIGEPVSVTDAAALAAEDPYQIQWWRWAWSTPGPWNRKKERTGHRRAHLLPRRGQSGQDETDHYLGEGGQDRPCPPSRFTRSRRSRKGRHRSADHDGRTHGIDAQRSRKRRVLRLCCVEHQASKLQILTVGELLEGKTLDAPPSRDIRTFKKAPRARRKSKENQQDMFD